MKIAILVYAKQETGLGHWYRSIELATRAQERGHYVTVVSNRMARPFTFFQAREGNETDLYHILHQVKPDCLVVDLQDSVPDYIYDITSAKIVVLNGVGYEKEDKADLTIIQGFSDKKASNVLSGVEYVILRKEIFEAKATIVQKSNSWFVWGGTKDKMNLLTTFPHVMEGEKSHLVINKTYPVEKWTNIDWNPNMHSPVLTDDLGIIPLMAMSSRACIAMGMVAWELAALEVPAYAFSVSQGHLTFAQQMQRNGLLSAYPKVGLPPTDEMKEFLSLPFSVSGNVPDEKGADRILDAMERL